MKALEAKVSKVAWKIKPSWYVVATEDGAIAPKLLRSTARRIGADTTEVAGSHVVFLTQPLAVAGVIDRAARRAAKTASIDPSASVNAARSPQSNHPNEVDQHNTNEGAMT
nr:alpha/beta hydrolase [Sinorhizobium fredii]